MPYTLRRLVGDHPIMTFFIVLVVVESIAEVVKAIYGVRPCECECASCSGEDEE